MAQAPAPQLITINLPSSSPGTQRHLKVMSYGNPDARPKVYIQGGIHADEIPPLLVLHHLKAFLHRATVLGQIVLVPFANPIGLGQTIADGAFGRFEQSTMVNFNRKYPDILEEVALKVGPLLTMSAEQNVAAIRSAMLDALNQRKPAEEVDFMKNELLKLAIDADIVIDMHCDEEAILHAYVGTPLWDSADTYGAKALCAQLQSRVQLTAEVSGGQPFDEAAGCVWWGLQKKFPQFPIPPACMSCTLEMRGESEIKDEIAFADARNLVSFLRRRGIVAGDPGPLPPLLEDATPLAGVDMIKATAHGVCVFCVDVGTKVVKGQKLADIVNVDTFDVLATTRTPVISTTDGVFFARKRHKFVRPGQVVAKVAGPTPLAHRVEGATDLLTM
eukprot:gnl/Hemi2/13916_TR4723_c0_g1_i1.p1 gnl/Hemi2/13916_TR4723_c0_g1~~gnl/Hemi2/13916_TR4723_c0_g1_i1.p1  ORF type:complete len:407 (+),score=99.32 gnl/Hemi2/13916_TR4723_c0_g1_i1:57-1223(+)